MLVTFNSWINNNIIGSQTFTQKSPALLVNERQIDEIMGRRS